MRIKEIFTQSPLTTIEQVQDWYKKRKRAIEIGKDIWHRNIIDGESIADLDKELRQIAVEEGLDIDRIIETYDRLDNPSGSL